MAEAQPQKPKATLISSSQNLSSNGFTNQFISEPAKVNLSDILKAPVKLEVQSMVDVPSKKSLDNDTSLENRVYRLERQVNGMSNFNIQEYVDKSIEARLKQIDLSKDIPNFISLSVDEDDMDKLAESIILKKHRRDDHNKDPFADPDKDSKKKKRKDHDVSSSKKTKDQP
ncbi:hypothetical protein Tco_0122192, partial [Tanacetum coccineum]